MIEWCTHNFAQASKTPLASSSWAEKLDIRNPSNVVDNILEGRITDALEHDKIRDFIGAAERKSSKLEINLGYEHFKSFAKAQQECKFSSPSGLQYGHMQTLAHDDGLLGLRFDIMILSLSFNIILDHWRSIWETLLHKDASRSFIHHFCNITIVEWDIQYLMKTIWAKQLTSNAIQFLHPSQNAMRGKVPQYSVLSHKVALDTLFLHGEDSVVIENEAANCYERIRVYVACLASLRAGLADQMARFFVSFLDKAKHFLFRSGRQFTHHFSNTPTRRV